MAILFFDMFAGIGGFRSGLEAIGGFECVGHCEIDKFANQAYNAIYEPKGEVYYEDARTIEPKGMPDFDLLCGGFPCQSFSIAGRRGGFADARGTLFFEIARIAAVKRPAYLLLENVPGLLSHDGGRTFAAILGALSQLGYDVTWQVLNSKDFGVPQSRKRVYIIGYLGEGCPGEVFSFTESNGKALMQILPGREGTRVYSPRGVSITLTSEAGGFGGKTGMQELRTRIAGDHDVRRAAMFLKLLRYSYSSGCKSYASQPFDLRRLFSLIRELENRMANVVIENQDFETLIRHYDRPDGFFYADPPYFASEEMYDTEFDWNDHVRLRDTLANVKGKFLLSYNDCKEIRDLYDGFSVFDFSRIHSMAQRYSAGKEFKELLIGNYDLYERERNRPRQMSMFRNDFDYEKILKECILSCKIKN